MRDVTPMLKKKTKKKQKEAFRSTACRRTRIAIARDGTTGMCNRESNSRYSASLRAVELDHASSLCILLAFSRRRNGARSSVVTADPKSARFEKAELSDQRSVPLTLFKNRSGLTGLRIVSTSARASVQSSAAEWELQQGRKYAERRT